MFCFSCLFPSFTNLTGKHWKALSLCNEEATVLNQTSPILSIRYQRPKTEITVSRLSGTWLHLFTSDQRPTPTALCILIHLSTTPPPTQTSLNDYARTVHAAGISSDWLLPSSPVWSDALVSELSRQWQQEQRGLSEGRLPASS